ncbi:MAG TPA: hypothetical protein DCO75_00455 [Fibrobacteres bacterium]|nr:hypothetical protein [Fibrobacterota bacterium]
MEKKLFENVHQSIECMKANPVQKKLSINPESYCWSSRVRRVQDLRVFKVRVRKNNILRIS